MIVTGLVAAATTIVKACVAVPAVGVVESVTLMEKLNDPAVVGVPLICPIEAFNERPAGNAPVLTDQVYGVVPPVAANVVA